jgi:hypothetical protein
MRKLIGVAVVSVTVALCGTASLAHGSSSTTYVAGFRPAYLPVVSTLNKVTTACASLTRRAELPACGRRVAAFRVAVAHLLSFVTNTPPPAKLKTANRELIVSIKTLQRVFARLAVQIKRKNLAGVLALGGLGHPIDNAIQGFVGAISFLDLALPGKGLPLPG